MSEHVDYIDPNSGRAMQPGGVYVPTAPPVVFQEEAMTDVGVVEALPDDVALEDVLSPETPVTPVADEPTGVPSGEKTDSDDPNDLENSDDSTTGNAEVLDGAEATGEGAASTDQEGSVEDTDQEGSAEEILDVTPESSEQSDDASRQLMGEPDVDLGVIESNETGTKKKSSKKSK